MHYDSKTITLLYILSLFINTIIILNIFLDEVNSVHFSMDSQFLVTGSFDNTIKLIDMQNLTVIHTF